MSSIASSGWYQVERSRVAPAAQGPRAMPLIVCTATSRSAARRAVRSKSGA